METKKDILKTITRFAQASEWERVIKEYHKLLEMDPDDITLHNSIGDAYSKLGEHRKAFEYYMKVLNDTQKKGNQTKLNFLYKKIAKLNPRKFDLEGKDTHHMIVKTVQAKDFFDKDDFENALPALKEAVKLDKSNINLYIMAGEIYEKNTDIGNAVEAYVKALRLMVEKDKKTEALDITNRILAMEPENVEAGAMAAEDLILKGKKEEAENMFKDILITLGDKNLTAEGKEIAKRAKDLGISYGEQFYAYFLFKSGQFDEAKKILEEKYELSIEEKLLLGKIYFKCGDFEKAKEMFLSMDPEVINSSDEILEQIGDIFLKTREYKKASVYYMKAIRMVHGENRMDHAIKMANKVLNVDADNIEVHELLADIYTKKHMKNNLIDIYMKLAALYELNGRAEDALKTRNRLSKLKMV
ncbi:MAG: tetratricopeptide repeat protein [Candidatus Goldiibacteriota bacterium]